MQLDEFETVIHSEQDLATILRIVRNEARDMGVVRQGYFFIPVFDEPNSPRTNIYSVGFPDEWVKAYELDGLREIDPFPAAALARGKITFWPEVLDGLESEPDLSRFARMVDECGLQNCFGIPLYGPNNRSGFAFFDFELPREQLDQEWVFRIRAMAQMMHQRICQILDAERNIPVLSAREREVLDWITQGKSNGVIAEILEISPETVRTYTKRVYQKLGANDRISALLNAVKLGLLRQPSRHKE